MSLTILAGGASSVRTPLKRIERRLGDLPKMETGGRTGGRTGGCFSGPLGTAFAAIMPSPPIMFSPPIIATDGSIFYCLGTCGSAVSGWVGLPIRGPCETGGVADVRFSLSVASVGVPIENRDILGFRIGPSKPGLVTDGRVQGVQVGPPSTGAFPSAPGAPSPLDPRRQNS